MACKNNKKNRRRAAFYGINQFDYEARKNLAKGQLPPKETLVRKSNLIQEIHGLKLGHRKLPLFRQTLERLKADVLEYFNINNEPF